MPTYQYACTECGERLEVVQRFADDPLTECPACRGRLRKLFSSVGVVFKGSGFYKTDSRAAASSAKGSSSPATAASKETKDSSVPSGDGGSSGSSTTSGTSTTSNTSSTSSGGGSKVA